MKSNFIVGIFSFIFCFSICNITKETYAQNASALDTIRPLSCPPVYSRDGANEFRWILEKIPLDEKNYSWLVTQKCMNDGSKKIFSFPAEVNQTTLRRKKRIYPVTDAMLCVAPNGKHFLLRYFSGTTRLVNAETSKEILLTDGTIPSYTNGGEVSIGFDCDSNLVLGTQCLNPLLVRRSLPSLAKEEDYNFRKMNYPPGFSRTDSVN